MTFIRREMSITVRQASAQTKQQETGPLTPAGDDTVTLTGHRCEAIVANPGGNLSMSQLQLRVFGMKASDMNKFVTPVARLGVRNDVIKLSAGDASFGMHQVFEGTIGSAVINYSGIPEVAFDVYAQGGLFEKIKPAAANSYEGEVDVATIVQAIAKQMGLAFRDYGVKVKLSNQYLHGTLTDQLYTVCTAARVPCSIDNGTVSIWPNDGGTDSAEVELSPQTGLVGYPILTPNGIQAVCEFNPAFHLGAKVRLVTSVPRAAGTWFVQNMRHELSTEQPQGIWFTTLMLADPGFYVSRWY